MHLDGWNYVPRGYGLQVDPHGSPRWLRVLAALPFLDRFAYPLLVHRGHAWLVPHPGWNDEDRDPVPEGWQVGEVSPYRTPPRRFED